ncbi:hypothetical protein D3C84_1087720 [compost metagenome]
MLGNVSEQRQGRLEVFLVAAVGKCSRQNAVGGLSSGAHVTDGYFVFTVFKIGPFGRRF